MRRQAVAGGDLVAFPFRPSKTRTVREQGALFMTPSSICGRTPRPSANGSV